MSFVFWLLRPCCEAHPGPDPAEDALLVDDQDRLFVVCPEGGCCKDLSQEIMRNVNCLHTCLCSLVRQYEPKKKDVSAHPLLLCWRSLTLNKSKYGLVAFSTRSHPMEMVLFELRAPRRGAEAIATPYTLELAMTAGSQVPLHEHDLSWCRQLGQTAADWCVSRLQIGPVQGKLCEFQVVGEIPVDVEALLQMARASKAEALAIRAARLAQGLLKPQGRASRSSTRKRKEGSRVRRVGLRQDASSNMSQEGSVSEGGADPAEYLEWSSGSDEALDAPAQKQKKQRVQPGPEGSAGPGVPAPEDGSAASSSSARCPAAPDAVAAAAAAEEASASGRADARSESEPEPVPPPPIAPPGQRPVADLLRVRTHTARAIPWGPWELAPVVPAGGQTGWGAMCKGHLDRNGSKTACKKQVSLGGRDNLGHAECILRLKRWLLAGLDDESWPRNCMRATHVGMGGRGLEDFANGMTEEQMDQIVADLAAGR